MLQCHGSCKGFNQLQMMGSTHQSPSDNADMAQLGAGVHSQDERLVDGEAILSDAGIPLSWFHPATDLGDLPAEHFHFKHSGRVCLEFSLDGLLIQEVAQCRVSVRPGPDVTS